MKKSILYILCILISNVAISQQSKNISGKVYDAFTKEAIQGAVIADAKNKIITKENGSFSRKNTRTICWHWIFNCTNLNTFKVDQAIRIIIFGIEDAIRSFSTNLDCSKSNGSYQVDVFFQ